MPMFQFECTKCDESKEFIMKYDESIKEDLPCRMTDDCEGFLTRKSIQKCSWKPGRSFHNGGYVSN